MINPYIPNSITAAVLEKKNKPIVLKKLRMPSLKKGQVLVKISYTGICRSQLMEAEGKRGDDRFLPHLLGHEATGIVIKTGKYVSKIKKGDKVVLGWIKGNGINTNGIVFKDFENKKINSGPITTFSDYTIVSENRVVKLNNKIPMDIGVLLGCAFPTGMGMIFNLRKKNIKIKNLLIIGLGGVGFSALMAAIQNNIKKIIVIDKSNYKLQIAKKFNKKIFTFNSNSKKIRQKILKITNGQGAQICIECAGRVSTIELGFDLINDKEGRLIFASHPENGKKIQIDPHKLISGKKIEGTWGGSYNPDKDIKKIMPFIINNKSNIRKYIIGKKYNLKSINKAFSDLKNSKVIRPLIKI